MTADDLEFAVLSALIERRYSSSYRAALVAWPLKTASIAAWAHCSPCPLETPIAPITWPFTTIGSAPGCGKSFMNVGARFSPLRTILFVSDVGRRHRNADLAFSRAVSMAFAAAPSMAWDSIRLPPQSKTAIATVCLFFEAQAEQASTRARAPALEMILMSLVICAEALGVKETPINTMSKSMESRMRMAFLLRFKVFSKIPTAVYPDKGNFENFLMLTIPPSRSQT